MIDDQRMPPDGHWSATTSDVDEAHAVLERVLRPRQLRLHLPAVPLPRLDMALNAMRVGELTVSYLQFGCGVRLTFETEYFHVNVPLCGTTNSGTGETEQVLTTAGRGAVFMPGVSAGIDWWDGCTQLCVMLPRHLVQLELEAMLDRPAGSIEFAPAMDLMTDPGRSWMAALRLIAQAPGLLDHPLVAGNLEKLLIRGLLVAQPHNYTDALTQPRPPRATGAVGQAIELIHNHPEQPWTTPTLARRVAVSARSLQEGFQSSTGLPPMRYLRDVRLNRVHEDLRAATPDSAYVAQIARRWGFLYLGRFAATYQEKFGKTPSETLRTPPPPRARISTPAERTRVS